MLATRMRMAGVPSAELTWLQATSDTSNLSAYTFAGQNLGDAHQTRHIIIAGTLRFNAARTVSTVTVAGIAASIVAQSTESTDLLRAFVAIAKVPEGATGDVVVTPSGACLSCRIGAWRATHLRTGAIYDTLTDSNVNDPSGTIDIPQKGFAVGVAVNTNAASAAWTGLTGRANEYVESDNRVIHGDAEGAAGETLAITANFDGSNTRGILVAASWH